MPFRLTRRSLVLVFTATGLACGLLIGNLSNALAASVNAKTPAKQHTLIALMQTADTLQGVWVVSRTMAGTQEWTPLYPAPAQSNSVYSVAHQAIVLSGASAQEILALPLVQDSGFSFENVLILDTVAQDALQTRLGSQQPLTEAWANPQAALLAQNELVQAACLAAWQPSDLEAWVALIPQHVQSTISIFELITRWDRWAQADFGLQCSYR